MNVVLVALSDTEGTSETGNGTTTEANSCLIKKEKTMKECRMNAGIAEELMAKATFNFQVYRKLSAHCPKCHSVMVLRFSSNPIYRRRLSIVMACGSDCDRTIWNAKVDEKDFTHWWLDGSRNQQAYNSIVESLPAEEKELVRDLEKALLVVNSTDR